MAVYHLGVAQCLIDRQYFPLQEERRPRLVGVSAGALVSAALHANISPREGLELTLLVARKARNAGRLDAFQPGFSLIDVVDQYFSPRLRENLKESSLLSQINRYKLLRIGLTDRRVFPPLGQNPRAFCYVEEFRSVEDVIAACILSSYIPGVTGPVNGQTPAVRKSRAVLHEMLDEGYVKQGLTGEPVRVASKQDREVAWDGGLVNAFPFIDEKTVIVCPLAASITHHATINPAIGSQSPVQRYYQVSQNVRLHMTAENLINFRRITVSSSDDILKEKFEQGYRNAEMFFDRGVFK